MRLRRARATPPARGPEHPRAYGPTRARLPDPPAAPRDQRRKPAQTLKPRPSTKLDSPTITPGAPIFGSFRRVSPLSWCGQKRTTTGKSYTGLRATLRYEGRADVGNRTRDLILTIDWHGGLRVGQVPS